MSETNGAIKLECCMVSIFKIYNIHSIKIMDGSPGKLSEELVT